MENLSQKERLKSIKRAVRRFSENKLALLGLLMIGFIVFIAIFAPYLAPYPEDVNTTHFDQRNESPSVEHLFGTDDAGRDILSRMLFGARISLMVGFSVIAIATTIGTTVGLVAGYIGGYIGTTLMRIVDMFLAIPSVVLAMAVVAAIGPGIWNVMLAIAFVWWTWYARLVYGEVISVKEEEFVKAGEALGAKWFNIIFSEILPNIVAPLTVKVTLDLGGVILVAAGLSFLGLGASPPTPSWGLMVASGRDVVTQFWWVATIPGLAISWTVLGFNLLGDGLRDMFDVEVE